jgi:ABC-type phosphate transport system permease subunit
MFSRRTYYLQNSLIGMAVAAALYYVVGAPSIVAGLLGFMTVGAIHSFRRSIAQ